MAIFPPKTYSQIVKALGPHGPDGLLAFGIFAGVLAASPSLGLLQCASFGLLVFAFYGIRKVMHERHTERMLFGEIRKKQLAIEEYCAKQQVKLRKRKQASIEMPQETGRRK